MTLNTQRSGRIKLRATLAILAVTAILGGSAFVYFKYLTPEKLAIRSRLNEADTRSEKAIDARLQPLAKLFDRGRKGAKNFAGRAVSWRGKWELMKGLSNSGASHRQFLSDEYQKSVFSSEELRGAIEASVNGFMDDIEVYESEMLIKLRADLANPEQMDDLPAYMRGDEVFMKEYRRMADQLMSELKSGICVSVVGPV